MLHSQPIIRTVSAWGVIGQLGGMSGFELHHRLLKCSMIQLVYLERRVFDVTRSHPWYLVAGSVEKNVAQLFADNVTCNMQHDSVTNSLMGSDRVGYSRQRLVRELFQEQKISPKTEEFSAGRPGGHPAKNFGQALQILEKQAFGHRRAARTSTKKLRCENFGLVPLLDDTVGPGSHSLSLTGRAGAPESFQQQANSPS